MSLVFSEPLVVVEPISLLVVVADVAVAVLSVVVVVAAVVVKLLFLPSLSIESTVIVEDPSSSTFSFVLSFVVTKLGFALFVVVVDCEKYSIYTGLPRLVIDSNSLLLLLVSFPNFAFTRSFKSTRS